MSEPILLFDAPRGIKNLERANLNRSIAARAAYDANPNICRYCRKPILSAPDVKVTYTRAKQFCNQKCAASFNNRIPHRRKKEPMRFVPCKQCGNATPRGNNGQMRVLCKQCAWERTNRVNNTPIGKLTHAEIRGDARRKLADSGCEKICINCTYSKHVHCCHRKPVADFDDATLCSIVNALENLCWLCPNCHWEFDHGLLVMDV